MMLLNASRGSPQDEYGSVFHPSTFNLYVPNAAAVDTVSLPKNVLLKLAFLNAGVKEKLPCIPKLMNIVLLLQCHI